MKNHPKRKLLVPSAALALALATSSAILPSAHASENVVPDLALRACINRDINTWAAKWKPEVGNRALAATISASDITQYLRPGSFKCSYDDLVKLGVSQKSVASLEGLQYATDPKAITGITVKSTSATASHQKITDLTPVATLTNLKLLDLSYNNISALPNNLAGLKNVESFNLEGNNITNVTALKGMENLTYLNIGYNKVNSLNGIESLNKIKELKAFHNSIRSLEPVKNLTNITDLRVDSNLITDISAVSRLSLLGHLEIQNNNNNSRLGTVAKTMDISALSGKPLSYLNAYNNNIADISALSTVKTLTSVRVDGNKIADLSPLNASPQSTKQAAPQNPLGSSVTRMDVNGKTEIDISKLKTVAGKTPAITRVVVLGTTGQVPYTLSGNKITLSKTYQSDIRVFYKAQGIAGESESQVDPQRVSTPAPSYTFTDVKPSDQFYTEITWLANKGITTGWSTGATREYRPLNEVERGAMAAFFYRMAGSPAYTAPSTPKFKDVPTTHQFYKEISWMAEKGITTGWSDGTFRPDAPVNRDAMAAFFYRLAGTPNYSAPSTSPFHDIKPGDQFYKEVAWLANTGISKGWDDGTFRPVTPIKRDAMAAFIYRYDAKF